MGHLQQYGHSLPALFHVPSIKESVMFVKDAKDIWDQLERRFSMTDGTRKYKLNMDAYDLKQKGKTMNEHYTVMKAIWNELDALDDHPPITVMNPEIRSLVNNMSRRKEEASNIKDSNGRNSKRGSEGTKGGGV
ncbi:Protein IRON-RELATED TRANSCRIPTION FACTOR 2 [Bienertia sinuspersici]